MNFSCIFAKRKFKRYLFSMNRLTFLVLILFLSAYSLLEAQTKKTSLQENNLIGNIKSIEEFEYGMIDANGNIEKETETGSTFFEYNRSGFISEQKVFDSKGMMGYKTTFEYENNHCVKENNYNSKNKIIERWHATYNDKGNIKEAYRVYEGKNIEKILYTYDNTGLLIEEKWFLNDVLFHKKLYIHDYVNHTVEKKLIDQHGNTTATEIATYNTEGILMEESKYNYQDSLKGKTICMYNEKEQLTEELSYGENNEFEGKIVFTYDEKGNIKEEKWYDYNNYLTTNITNTYTFDAKGNWIEKIEYDTEIQNGTIYKRKITYYN